MQIDHDPYHAWQVGQSSFLVCSLACVGLLDRASGSL